MASANLRRKLAWQGVLERLFAPAAIVSMMAVPGVSRAIDITLNNDDQIGSSSFTLPGHWSPAVANLAGNDAFTSAYRLRTPDAQASATFGADSLTINNGGSLSLKAANNGTVTVDNLTVQGGGEIVQYATVSSTLISNGINLTGVATLDGRATGRVLNIQADLSGTGGINVVTTLSGVGTVSLDGTNTYTGSTTVGTTGRLSQSGAESFSAASNTTVNGVLQLRGFDGTIGSLAGAASGIVENASGSNAQLTIAGTSSTSFSGTMRDGGSGDLSVVKTGTSRQTFSGNGFTYTGSTTIEDGQLRLSNGASLASSSSVAITGAGSGTLELDNTNVNYGLTLEGRGSDTAHIDNIAGNNSVSGNLTLQETVDGNDPAEFTINSSADTLTISGSVTYGDAADSVINLGGAANGEVSGAIDNSGAGVGTGTLEKEGTGQWTISGGAAADAVNVNDGTLVFGNAVTTTGDVTVADGGTLTQSGGSFIDRTQQSGSVTVTGPTGLVDVNGEAASMNALNGDGEVDNSGASPATLTLGNTSAVDGAFSGSVNNTNGALSIVKDGTNTQTFASGSSIDVDGSVGVTGGTLNANGVVNAADGVDVSGGTGNFAGTVNVSAGSAGIDLTGGASDFSGTVNIGSGDIDASTGSHDFGGNISGSGNLNVTGGTVAVSGDNSGLAGEVNVSGGTLNVSSNNALGTGSDTDISGTGRVNVDGGVTLNEVINLFGVTSTDVQLNNVASANTIQGAVNLVDGGNGGADNYNIESASGTLALDGGVASALTTGTRTLRLGGDSTDGTNTIGTLSMAAGASNNITKLGDSTWRIDGGTVNDAAAVVTQGGTLALTGNANIDGLTTEFLVQSGATLDVSGLSNDFTLTDGQRITGSGAINGDVVVNPGSPGGIVAPGEDVGDIDTLAFNNLLDLDGTLMIDLTGVGTGAADMIAVGETLDITAASVQFDVLSALDDAVYVFASYGSLSGTIFASITDQPTGYSIDYNYNGNNQIALVSDTPIPTPAPLALIGLGAFMLARQVRRSRR